MHVYWMEPSPRRTSAQQVLSYLKTCYVPWFPYKAICTGCAVHRLVQTSSDKVPHPFPHALLVPVLLCVCVCAGSEHTGGKQGSQQQAAAPVGHGGHGSAGLE